MDNSGTGADYSNNFLHSPVMISPMAYSYQITTLSSEADSVASTEAILTTDTVSTDTCKYMPEYS
jgi:hypothetical protein